MTEKTLNRILLTLNKKQSKNNIFIRQLTENVDLAKIYMDIPKMSDRYSSGQMIPYTFYCIKNENAEYVAIVLDMNTDLHWFVKKEYRKKGHLTNAMKTCILPYIFQYERNEQRITISKYELSEANFLASQKVASNLGFNFESITDGKYIYILNDVDFTEIYEVEGVNNPYSSESLLDIAKQLNYYSRKLIRIQSDLEARYSKENEIVMKFKDRIIELSYFAVKIEELNYDT